MIDTREIRHFHLFCGLGGGAAGFNRGRAKVGNMQAKFRCIGGIDSDAAGIADFERLSGTSGTVMDLFSREQYQHFHGRDPSADWREATPSDVQKAAGNERPHIVFLSAPCKGFSGLLSQTKSTTPKYQALNALTLRGVWLMLEAFKDDPAELVVFENVPRIANRGRPLLDQIVALLQHYGYAVAETTHDCGELGGLAQSRKRFLLVARHQEKVPAFLYEPVKRPLRGVGEVLEHLPLPGAEVGGPMHRVPSLQWKTWVRLAFVEAGKDWRSLNRLAVEDGVLSDYLIVPEYRSGYLGVNAWDQSMGTVAGRNTPSNGSYSVADPRFSGLAYAQYGVVPWDRPASTVTCQRSPGQGRFSVADPRSHSGFGGKGKYRVTDWRSASGTVIAGSTTGQGAFAVCDPRPGMNRAQGDHYLTGGHYGVVPWDGTCGAVSASARQDNGRWSVADPRMPEQNEKTVAVIRALDGTWHRPFTTLELAAIQGLVDPEARFLLDGKSDQAWRERIGNAVPPPAAEAIAGQMGETLLLSWSGETFVLSSTPLWVRDIAMALSVQGANA